MEILLDNEQFFNRYKSPCLNCKHFNKDETNGIICKAFEKGIPNEILLGKNDHSKPLDFQENEIVFEEIEKPESK